MAIVEGRVDAGAVTGKRFYHPAVLFMIAFVFNVPLALFLYATNFRRRGQPVFALIYATFGLLLLLAMFFAPFAPRTTWPLIFAGWAIGFGIMQLEWGPYRRAIRLGGVDGGWLFPILMAIGMFVVWVLVVAVIFMLNPALVS